MRRDQSSVDGTFEVSCVVPLQASASALHAAADRCDLDGVEWALAAGADPSTREAEHGLTPLSLACGGASQRARSSGTTSQTDHSSMAETSSSRAAATR